MRKIGLLVVLALAAAAAGCGSAGPGAPSAQQLVADAVQAIGQVDNGSVRYELDADVSISPDGAPSGLLGNIVKAPLHLEVEGGFGVDGLTASGHVEALGEKHAGELRMGPPGFFVRVGEDWYGTEDGTFEGSVDRSWSRRALDDIDRFGERVFGGSVEDGPDIDGDTWKATVELEPEGIVEVAKANGETLDPAVIRRIVEGLQLTFYAGKDDGLPRRIEATLKGSPAQWGISDLPVTGIERAEVRFSLTLRDWGEELTVEAPESYRSLEQVIQGFLFGGALSSEAGEIELEGALPEPPPEVELQIPELPRRQPAPPHVDPAPPQVVIP